MLERDISTRQVLNTISRGQIQKKGPTRDKFGGWTVTMKKHSAAGRTVEVVLALEEYDHGRTLTVITVM